MAAAPQALASALYADATKWTDHDPDYGALMAVLGGGTAAAPSATSAPNAARGLLNTAVRTPTALAIVLQDQPGYIYVVHSLTSFPANVAEATGYDNLIVGLMGDNINTALPLVLPAGMFTRITIRAHTVATIRGANGHSHATNPVYIHGPHANTAPDTEQLSVRSCVMLPPSMASTILAAQPRGKHTLLGFWNLIEPEYTAGGDRQTAIAPVTHFWQAASTHSAGGVDTTVSQEMVTDTDPIHQAALQQWVATVRENQLARLGIGGPGLTTAAFSAGIAAVNTTLQTTHNDAIAFQKAQGEKTFTQKYGKTVATTLHNLCNVTDDTLLPDIHGLLAKAPKNQSYAILANLVQEALSTSNIPLTLNQAPLATTSLVTEVFQRFAVANSGLEFGKGLSPFAVVCEGHAEARLVQEKMTKAEYALGGTTVTMEDATLITTSDVRFPTDPQVAAQKLYGWAIFIEIFHGTNHDITKNVQRFVTTVGPMLHAIYTQAGTAAVGNNYVARVLFEAQQDYFSYVRKAARKADATVPDFERIIEAVTTYRPSSLADIPQSWRLLPNYPFSKTPEERSSASSGNRPTSPTTPVTNPHTDSKLVTRFRLGGFTSIKAMMEGKDATIPSHRGKPVCLVWALKGECNATCKRKDQHIDYPATVTKAIHSMLTKCGVPDPQP